MNKINSGLLNTLFVLNKVLIPVNDIVFAPDECFDDRPEVAAAKYGLSFRGLSIWQASDQSWRV
jgi:hypothetical protein